VRAKLVKGIHLFSAFTLLVSCTTSSLKPDEITSMNNEVLRDIASEQNSIELTNPVSKLTYWQEYQAIKASSKAKKQYVDERTDSGLINLDIPFQQKAGSIVLKEKLFAKTNAELYHFLVWMRANPISAFQDIRNNQQSAETPKGIMQFKALPKSKFPYPVGDTIVVTKMDDVLELMDNPKTFSVRNYTNKMEESVGPFMLSYDESRYNIKEKPWMRKMLPASDLPRVRKLVKDISMNVLADQRYVGSDVRGKDFGRLEVVNQYARRAPILFTQEYFGLKRVKIEKLFDWSRATQDDFFHNLVSDDEVKKKAEVAGKEFHEYLKNYIPFRADEIRKEMITNRISNDVDSDSYKKYYAELDILSRLILDNTPDVVITENNDQASRIRSNIIGTLVGGIETTQAAIAQAFNEIQKRPKWLEYARKIAYHAEIAEMNNDEKTLKEMTGYMEKLVWEALRFHPVNPIVVRYAEKDYTMKNGFKISKGAHVLIATQSAMFDEKYFVNPNAFNPMRVDDAKFVALSKTESFVKESADPNLRRFENAENHPNSNKWTKFQKSYFHLGYGHHRCLGDYIGEIHVPEMTMQLFKLPNVKAVDGQAGTVDFRYIKVTNALGDKFYYSFPERYSIEFDANSSLPRISSLLKKKQIEIADKNYPYEAYLQDFDRNLYRKCLAGWDINKEASELNKKDFVAGIVSAAVTHDLNADGKNKDFLYCRMNKDFQDCMNIEKKNSKFHHLGGEDRQTGNKMQHNDFDKHLAAFGQCSKHLNKTEMAFYENVFFGKELDYRTLDLSKSVRNNELYKFEDDLKFYSRFNSRESMLNPLGWKKIPESEKALMYTRLDLGFRLCFGKKVNIEKVPVLKAYNICKDGVYMPKQFVKVGALSQVERFYMLRDYLKVPGVTTVDSVKGVEVRLEQENP
jgi:cytochrome P450